MSTFTRCDRCMKEIDSSSESAHLLVRDNHHGDVINAFDLCSECYEIFDQYMKDGIRIPVLKEV